MKFNMNGVDHLVICCAALCKHRYIHVQCSPTSASVGITQARPNQSEVKMISVAYAPQVGVGWNYEGGLTPATCPLGGAFALYLLRMCTFV